MVTVMGGVGASRSCGWVPVVARFGPSLSPLIVHPAAWILVPVGMSYSANRGTGRAVVLVDAFTFRLTLTFLLVAIRRSF